MYQFAPSWSAKPTTFLCAENLFTDDELRRIVEIGNALKMEPAQAFDPIKNSYQIIDYRKCTLAYVNFEVNTKFIYEKIATFINLENEKHFGFDIYGFEENFQYLIYDNLDNHFEWHVDMSSGNTPYRKLTFSLQLSDPSEYEGGELQLMLHKDPFTLPQKLGAIALFPSYTLHRVTHITKGIRRSLVGWVTGKAFR